MTNDDGKTTAMNGRLDLKELRLSQDFGADPRHLNEVWLAAAWLRHRNVAAIAREAERSTTTIRRQLRKLPHYSPRRQARPRAGADNGFFGRRHSAQTRLLISQRVREASRHRKSRR